MQLHLYGVCVTKSELQYDSVCQWLNPQMCNHGYGELTVQLYVDFQTA